LATERDGALWLRYIDEGTRDPGLAAALCARSEPAVIAAVGLNLETHERAAALLLDRLRDTSLSVEHRAKVAVVALELVEEPGPLANACVAALREAIAMMHEPNDSIHTAWRAFGFWNARSHWEPTTVGSLIDVALGTGFNEPYAVGDLVNALIRITDRLDAAEAERLLHVAMQRASGNETLQSIGEALGAVAARLESPAALSARREQVNALRKAFANSNSSPQVDLLKALIALTSEMEPAEGAVMLAELLDSASHPADLSVLAHGLAATATRMPDEGESQLCNNAARALLARMRPSVSDDELRELSKALAAILVNVPAADRLPLCDQAARALIECFLWQPHEFAEAVAESLSEIAAILNRDESARICTPAAEQLTKALEIETEPSNIASFARGCSVVAVRLENADKRRIFGVVEHTLNEALRAETNLDDLEELAEPCAFVAGG